MGLAGGWTRGLHPAQPAELAPLPYLSPPQVGSEGCGKSSLPSYCFRRLMGANVTTLHCSAQTNAANVIQKLVQVGEGGPWGPGGGETLTTTTHGPHIHE